MRLVETALHVRPDGAPTIGQVAVGVAVAVGTAVAVGAAVGVGLAITCTPHG